MITLITGAPRSGKSLYTVDKLIPPEIGRVIDIDDEQRGQIKVTRRVLCNINQLQLDHEQIDGDWLEHLHEKRQVGDFVVFDEVQRVWPNRPTGAKIPSSVEYLQTHGHDALDLVILTQNPMLIDPGVRALVGRHIHVRKVGGLGGAILYEWDGCSNSLNFKNAFRKSAYKYSAKAQTMYKSAKGHTGSRAGLPFVAWIVLVGVIGSAFAWPQLFGRIFGMQEAAAKRAEPQPAALSTAAPGAPGAPAAGEHPRSLVAMPPASPVQPLVPIEGQPAAPVFSGCAFIKLVCTCYDTAGRMQDGDPSECRRAAGTGMVRLNMQAPELSPRPSSNSQADAELIAWVHRQKPAPWSLHR